MAKATWGSIISYRKGPPPKARKHKPIYEGSRRKHKIDQIVDLLRDWRLSPFEHEGTCRAGIRSALCLKGHGWERSDREAADLIAEAFRKIGTQRPTWDQGQREYVTPRENCSWCGGGVPEDMMKGTRHSRFCSDICARSAITYRDFEDRARDSLMWQDAWTVIGRMKVPPRPCRECGKEFRPFSWRGDGEYCSPACSVIGRRKVEERACLECGKLFRPHGLRPTGRFCSHECYRSHGRLPTHQVSCAFCDTTFWASDKKAKYCCERCRTAHKRFLRGVNPPKLLLPPVFDYIFREAA